MTGNTPPRHDDPTLRALALGYLNGELSTQEVDALRGRLLGDQESAKRFVEYVQVATLVRETVQRDEGVRKELSLPSDQGVNYDEIMASLTPPDDLPPIEIIATIKRERSKHHEPAQRITAAQAADAIGYLFRQSRPAILTGAAIAAVLLLAVSLYLVLGTGSEEPSIVGVEDTPGLAPIVAVLSAEQDATWQVASGGGTPSAGQSLHAGQKLTLLSGTAQVTTRRGAIANLQAPCTVELLEGGNALALIRGKLVGICETPRSKGFLVQAPQMRVTDLGTRFGVDASRDGVTEVHIFDGEVKVAPPGESEAETERVLSAGQAVAARGDGRDVVAVAPDMNRFASIQEADLSTARPVSNIAGVRSISGDVKAASAARFNGTDAGQWPTSDDAFVFHDFVGQLKSDVRVNLADPGRYNKLPEGPEALVAAGTNVSSYVLYKTANPADTTTIVRGSITFENEVVGIITQAAVDGEFVAAIKPTSPVFTPGTGGQSWLELQSFEESITLSDDLRTVSFQLQVKQSTDTVRILVRTQ